MKQKLLLKAMLLLCALIAGSSSVWADTYTLQLSSTKKFSSTGLTDGSISWSTDASGGATVGNWENTNYKGQQFGTGSTKGNVILSTSSITGTITQVEVYSQTGTSGGATVAVSVGGTSWGSQNMKVPSATGENPGLLTFTGSKTGAIQITLTQTVKKAMYLNKIIITYTPSSTPSSGVSFTTENPSINWPTSLTYTQTATTASGYSSTAGASVTYSIGSTNTCVATINTSTGEVTPTKGGSVQVVATAAAIDGKFTQSTASYTLTVNDVRPAATLSWSKNSVEILKDAASYTLPTLNNPNSLEVTYTVEGTDGLASVTPAGVVTVNTGIVGSATVKASFAGNNSYKPKNATYTINVVDPTVKGSKYNPYNVTEVRAVSTSTTINDVYVEGYIIGYANSTYGFTNDATLFQNSNWVIADSKNESNVAKTAPVQIASGNQSNYGLSNHPELVGAKVLIKGDITKYFTVSGVKNLDEITIVSIPVAIGSTGWATISRGFALDFENATPAGLSAYMVTGTSGSAITKSDAVDNVPANTGLLLNGVAGTYTIPVLASSSTSTTGNLMKACVAKTDVNFDSNSGYNYVLAANGGKAEFQKIVEGANGTVKIPAGKAYLALTADPGAPALSINFGDETGINAVNGSELKVNGEYYNLAGQRVANPTKGLYIVNGKKVIVK